MRRKETSAAATLVPRPPPSFANKLARGIWGVAWLLLFRLSPRPFHFWRRLVLRLFGARIGKGAKPYPSARIWAPWNLVMGQGSTLGDEVDCYCVAPIVLGTNATVSQRTFLCSASRDIDGPERILTTAPIVIADNAWVAAECFVAPGVTMGAGSVAAARSVVLRDVVAGAVVGGHPAKLLRMRELPADDAERAEIAG